MHTDSTHSDTTVPRIVIRLPGSVFSAPPALHPAVRALLLDLARTLSAHDDIRVYIQRHAGGRNGTDELHQCIQRALTEIGIPEDRIRIEIVNGAHAATLFPPKGMRENRVVIQVEEHVAA